MTEYFNVLALKNQAFVVTSLT